ncbi:MAG TPA: HmuY family protein, partial [Bacteroidia bacterium]|nr:HmuY family protein [Bacteroidia bacterium]
ASIIRGDCNNINYFNLNDVHDTIGCNWKYDSPGWETDSTAFGQWSMPTGNPVYIIERSLVSPASPQDRFWKMTILQSNSTAYTISYARLTDTVSRILTLPKIANQNYTHFSFNNGGSMVSIEPDKQKWDIVFSRYRFIYHDFSPPLPYYVNGVLLNAHLTFAAVDSVTPYDSIHYAQAVNYTLKNKRDVIGFDWKIFNFTSQKYEVKPYYVYIIKDQEGYYYKLHFLSFYDPMGIAGAPAFEFHRL